MSQAPRDYQSPLDEAFSLLKMRDIKNARSKLGLLSDSVTDEEFIQGMISLEQGINMFIQGKQPEAVEQFHNALPIINNSTDEETKLIIPALASFSEGISRLLNGDAHGAQPLLDISADAIQRLSFFIPNLDKLAFSFKAANYLALARADLNVGDITSAELWFGKAHNQHEQLLALLDPKKEEDIPGFVEVYASRIEVVILFVCLDLQVFDLDELNQRLTSVSEDVSKLQIFIEMSQPSLIRNIAEVIFIIYYVLKDLYILEKDIVFGRLSVNRERIKKLQHIAQELFKAKEIARRSAERGKLYLYTINQLSKVQQNLLIIGKIGKEDFGRFSGIISFCSLLVLLVIVHLTIKPSGVAALLYFLGELIISLIVGFGFGAIRFRPLLKLYSEALKTKDEKDA